MYYVDDFPKISEPFPKISKGQTNVFEYFPEIMSEDYRRFPKITEYFHGRSDDVRSYSNTFIK